VQKEVTSLIQSTLHTEATICVHDALNASSAFRGQFAVASVQRYVNQPSQPANELISTPFPSGSPCPSVCEFKASLRYTKYTVSSHYEIVHNTNTGT
jgi:hypothetical protein